MYVHVRKSVDHNRHICHFANIKYHFCGTYKIRIYTSLLKEHLMRRCTNPWRLVARASKLHVVAHNVFVTPVEGLISLSV
jgi:hypothetical protein